MRLYEAYKPRVLGVKGWAEEEIGDDWGLLTTNLASCFSERHYVKGIRHRVDRTESLLSLAFACTSAHTVTHTPRKPTQSHLISKLRGKTQMISVGAQKVLDMTLYS